ncbi:MAG: DUF3006 domain-containing protein [Clostridia bacterium]
MKSVKSMEIRVTVDRIEEGKAVLLVSGQEVEAILWPVQALPEGVREGTALRIFIHPDEEATQAAKARVENLLKKLVAKDS